MNYILHNVENVKTDENGYKLLSRLPEDVRLSLATDSGKNTASFSPSGCELRFVLEGEKAIVKLFCQGNEDYFPKMHLYFGDYQSGWENLDSITLHKGINELEIKYPQNIDRLVEFYEKEGGAFSPKVVRISGFRSTTVRVIDVDGDIRKPTVDELPKKKILFYGSSITHGSLSMNINSCFSAIVGRNVGADIINKGLAGSCYLEDGMIDFVFNYDTDMFVVELGTNCYSNDKDEWFRDRVDAVMKKHEEICPDKPLVLIDILRPWPVEKCYESVRDIIGKYNNKNVIYVNGFDILPGHKYYTTDMCHPTMDSHYLIAKKLISVIKEIL